MIKNYYIHKDGIDKPVAKLTIHETLLVLTAPLQAVENIIIL